VRLVMLAAWVLLLAVALVPLLRRYRLLGTSARVGSDELVKDPVCQTYVVRSRAVSRETASGVRHFCSAECAGRFRG
jgi:YHS domain-containing protein